MNLIERGRSVVRQEARALDAVADAIGESFAEAVRRLRDCRGRVVVTGVGKAGNVARKVSATLASTGAPSMFLHPADGLHGDLGMVAPDDVALAFSHRGQSEEVLRIVPYLTHFRVPLIAVTGNARSELARQADVRILLPPLDEACGLVHAPTCSTTAMLAIGDALAVTLLELRGFTATDFAIRHPGGALGKRLLVRVGDLIDGPDANPVVAETASFEETILELTGKNRGAVSVVDGDGRLAGIVTDGDLKRILTRSGYRPDLVVRDLMTRDPIATTAETMGVKALDLMESRKTTVLPVVDDDGRPVAMLNMHDLIRAGIT